MDARYIAGVLGVIMAGAVHAQTPAADLQLRAESSLVLVPVSVVDWGNRPVAGLGKANFRIFEDDVEQTVTHFVAERSPIALGLVIDASASMRENLFLAEMAAGEILKDAGPLDEFFLVEFNETPRLVAPLTRDLNFLASRMLQSAPDKSTALFDAIHFSLREIARSESPRRALVVVTDGRDSSSVFTSAETERAIRENSVTIYTVGVLGRLMTIESRLAAAMLTHLAEETGGRFYEAGKGELNDVARKIGRDLRARYMLGYQPGNTYRDGRFHRIRVQMAPPTGAPRLRAAWRTGYYAPEK